MLADPAWENGLDEDGNGHTDDLVQSVFPMLDDGIDYTHPDLYLNIWLNEGEIPANIVDSLTDMQVPLDDDGYYTIVYSRREDRPDNATGPVGQPLGANPLAAGNPCDAFALVGGAGAAGGA